MRSPRSKADVQKLLEIAKAEEWIVSLEKFGSKYLGVTKERARQILAGHGLKTTLYNETKKSTVQLLREIGSVVSFDYVAANLIGTYPDEHCLQRFLDNSHINLQDRAAKVLGKKGVDSKIKALIKAKQLDTTQLTAKQICDALDWHPKGPHARLSGLNIIYRLESGLPSTPRTTRAASR